MISLLVRVLFILYVITLALCGAAWLNLPGWLDTLAEAQSVRRDAGGAIVPCQWFDETTNTFTRCTTTGPLPVTTGDVGATQDPFGWGKGWAQPWGTTTPVRTALSVGGNELIGFTGTSTQSGNIFSYAMKNSFDVGRTWNPGVTRWFVDSPNGAVGMERMALDATNGRAMFAVSGGGGIAVVYTSPTTNFVQFFASTGLAGQFRSDVSIQDLVCQSGTCVIQALQQPATTTMRTCRSTDGGQTWSGCVNLAASVGSTAHMGQSIASPAAGIWLALDIQGRLFRSTDDAVTWSLQTTLTPDGLGQADSRALKCLSATVCLAHRESQVHRTTDAGATWSTGTDLSRTVGGVATTFGGFVDYGSGLVTLIVMTPTDFNSILGMRSDDFGQSWGPIAPPTVTGTAAQPQTDLRAGIAIDGRAYYTSCAPSLCTTTSAVVNFKIPPGSVILVDETGTGGQTRVIQGPGSTAATSPWVMRQSDGVAFIAPALDRTTAAAPFATRESDGTNFYSPVAPPGNTSIQGSTLTNSQTTGAANTAVVVTLTAAANVRVHLYRLDARCSGGTSSLTVESPSGTTIWSTAAGEIGTTNAFSAWNPGLTAATNTAIVITLATCGVGNTGTLIVQGDRF